MLFTFLSVTGLNKEKGVFGYQMFVVLSSSMEGVFSAGDVVVSRSADESSLAAGDIITFKSVDPDNYGLVITHKIEKKTTYNGETAFTTFGIATGKTDNVPVPAQNVIGKYVFRIPKAGYVSDFLRSSVGYVVLILLPVLFILLFEGANFVSMIKQYRKEQRSALESQRRELIDERRKSEEMMKELARMREALEVRRTDGAGFEPQDDFVPEGGFPWEGDAPELSEEGPQDNGAEKAAKPQASDDMGNIYMKSLVVMALFALLMFSLVCGTYAFFIDNVKVKSEFVTSLVRASIPVLDGEESAAAEYLGRWSVGALDVEMELLNSIAGVPHGSDFQKNLNAVFYDWRFGEGDMISDTNGLVDIISAGSIEDGDLLFTGFIFKNYSNTPVYIKAGLSGASDNFTAVYTVVINNVGNSGGGALPYDGGERFAKLEYAEFENEEGVTEGWFYSPSILPPVEANELYAEKYADDGSAEGGEGEDRPLEYDEYVVWICAYILELPTEGVINLGTPEVELIQAHYGAVDEALGWKDTIEFETITEEEAEPEVIKVEAADFRVK
jgi:signal peptidase